MGQLDETLQGLLDKRTKKGRFRSLKEYNTAPGSGLVDFSSNDYLSLTTDPALRSAYIARLSAEPVVLGSTGSRLLSGGTSTHSALERRLESHFNAPSALLFNSGWDANVSFFGTVPQPGDWVVHDELVHASVHSGMRASRVPVDRRVAFLHNDAASLASVLKRINGSTSASGKRQPTVFLALESLYSMDGDFAPIPCLLDVMDTYVPRSRQCVVVDEAHSTGVYGSGGRGVVHALGEGSGADGVNGRVTVRLMTFGKGVGCSGAVLLSSTTVRSFLINFARPFIFSTALPLSTVFAVESAWDLLASTAGKQRRQALVDTVTYFYDRVGPLVARTPPGILRFPDETPVPFPDNPSGSGGANEGEVLPPRPTAPIVGLLSPTPHALSAFLLERGFVVRPVVPPTVPAGGERVRVCLRAGMDRAALDGLADALEEWVASKVAEAKGKGRVAGDGVAKDEVLVARAKL